MAGIAIGEAVQGRVDKIQSGDPRSIGEVTGEALVAVVEAVVGTKGATALTKATKAPVITQAYKRPANATTAAQRASVQGKPCVTCGRTAGKMVADHKKPLVEEYYETGTIDEGRMRTADAVQPQCPTCSARQGAEKRQYSIEKRKEHGLPKEEE